MPPKIKIKKERDPYEPWKSAWIITVNSNQTNRSIIPAIKIVWTKIIENLHYFTYGIGILKSAIETNRTFEMGPKYKRIHMHTKLEISGNGLVNLNYKRIQWYFNKQLRKLPYIKGIYVNATLIKNYNHEEKVARYLGKANIDIGEQFNYILADDDDITNMLLRINPKESDRLLFR